jgi:hypothetical protein
MKDSRRDVYLEVQAALLNSECSPGEAVEVALEAIAGFAQVESMLRAADFYHLAREAWDMATAVQPPE